MGSVEQAGWRHVIRRGLTAAALLGASALPLAAQGAPDWAAFDRSVAKAARDWHVPGLAIAVVSNDSLVFARGYGVIEAGKPTPATEHTRFAIGSTTKAMTTAALAMLVDEGKLRWDDRVIDYLPELRLYDPYATHELTVRDLLTHRTGLPGTDLLWAIPENQYPMAEMIRRLRFVHPASSFRTTFWSSVSDMSKWMRFILDSGRVGSTRLIKPATFEEIVAPQIRAPLSEYPALELSHSHFFAYALGWFVQDYHGNTVWMHTGSIDGMSAIIGLLPGQRVGVYVLANFDHAELRHALMYEVFDLYRGAAPRDWSTEMHSLYSARRRGAMASASKHAAGTHPSLPLERYAGRYADSTYGIVTVELAGGALRARFENADLGVLAPWEYDSFRSTPARAAADPATVTFLPDGTGHVAAVRLFGVRFARAERDAR